MRHIGKFLLLITLLTSSMAFGQITADPEDRGEKGAQDPLRTQTPEGRPLPFGQRLRVGGGISGLSIGNPFSIGISPVVAYQASERAVLGVGVNYVYYRARYANGLTDQFNQYGGRLFGLYELVPKIVPNLYGHLEYESTNIRYPDFVAQKYQRRWVGVPLLGVTYSQRIGRLAGINLSALYNVNYRGNEYAQYIYGSPWVLRISFF